MAKTKNTSTPPTEIPKVVVPEKAPQDFFRSNSFNKNIQTKFKPQRDFTGFRRGSR
jgi:hypothetical protein